LIFTGIGVLSAHYDTTFVELILGEGYVNMTIENIEKGNAVGVYQQGSNFGSAVAIILNNLRVGAYLFILGVFAGLGTLLYFLYNCIMLGAFQYFFYQHGALEDSMRGIWIHGVFEIFSMVVEAMAGLMLGSSILFPKTYSRFNSFKIGAKNAIKIFVSTIPFTIIAGILEGFVTRYALKMNEIFNSVLILGMLAFISFYYFVYPHFVNKKLNLLRLKCLLQCFIVSKIEKSETLSILQCFIVHVIFLLLVSPFFYPKFATKKTMKISHEKNLKDKAIILRISSSQKALWKKYCAEKKMSLTDFIVSAVENKMSAQERREVLKFIEKQDNIFAKIENNINQFAHIANAKKDISPSDLNAFTKQLDKIQHLKREQNQIFRDIYKLIANDS